MVGTHFDQLLRAWHGAGTRRGVLRLLAALSLGGVGALPFDPESGGAVGDEKQSRKQRCRRRKKKGSGHHGRRKSCLARHGGDRKNKNRKKQRCTPDPMATTCTGKCGPVTNNCQKTVDCGSCACDPLCDACLVCNDLTGVCETDPSQQGDACGEPGQFCQESGDCACDATSCATCETCQGTGLCAPAPDETPCGGGSVCCGSTGSCTDTQTDPNNCGACGNVCTGATPVCWDGACVCGDVCGSDCQFTIVQDAIDNASDGDTISLCASTYSGNIAIDKDLTLVGAGATTLQADDTGPVVIVALTATAAIRDLTITGGNGNEFGGGIFNDGTLEMTGVTVRGNSTATSGGGIVTTGTLQMTECAVTGNTSSIGGGINNRGTLSLSDCTVSNNVARDFGGGIFNAGTGTVTLRGGAVNGNDAGAGGGGGIFNSGTVMLEAGAVIMANDAGGNGGGIFNDDSAGGGISTCTGGSSVSGNDPNDCIAAAGGSCDGC